MAQTPEKAAWSSMHQRCRNPNVPHFKDYGGRGIQVCKRWWDRECFLTDMGPRPSHEHSLDRIDNDGNYEPANCRWATRKQQAQNTRRSLRWVTQERKRLTFELDRGLWAILKAKAAECGQPLSAFCRQAIQGKLDRDGQREHHGW